MRMPAHSPFPVPVVPVSTAPLAETETNTIAAPVARRQLRPLTALRFVAAVLIVVEHSAGRFGIPADFAHTLVLDQAVSFFFILSGFILTFVYPTLAGVGTRRFLQARIARIWPGHLAALALFLLLIPADKIGRQDGHSLDVLAANLALVQSWIPLKRFFYSFNTVSWSISTELGFYLLFPLLIRRWERTWWWKLLAAFGVVCLFATVITRTHLPASSGLRETGLLYISPLGRAFEFVLGMSVALLWRRFSPRIVLRRPAATALELAAFALVAALMASSITLAAAARTVPWIGDAGAFWLREIGITACGFAALIFVMALESGWVSRLLALPAFVLLGEISFGVYLVHPVLMAYAAMHARALFRIPPAAAYLLFWLTTLLVAYCLWVFIEMPARRLLVSLGAPRPTTPPTPPRVGRGNTVRRALALCALVVVVAPVAVLSAMTPRADAGHLDAINCARISGWAWDETAPDLPVTVALLDGETPIAQVVANQPRPDLRGNGFGSGAYGFALPFPPALRDGNPHALHLRIVGTDTDLIGTPLPLACR